MPEKRVVYVLQKLRVFDYGSEWLDKTKYTERAVALHALNRRKLRHFSVLKQWRVVERTISDKDIG